MEYVRKYRWANYSNPKCKEYLRNDFLHECAYCKLQEQEVGIAGQYFFEVDHFKPQSLKLPDIHQYHNLYYSCSKCNKEKSDIWDEKLLDPCVDDIFSGDNPAIIEGKQENQYKYIAKNDRGEFYINTFKLNSRAQIRIRKARENHQNNVHTINTLIDEIILKSESNAKLQDLGMLISRLSGLKDMHSQEIEFQKDEIFEQAEEYLTEKGIENSSVFEEYNMDMKLKISGSTYYCELIVDNSEKEKVEYRKNLSVEKLRVWFKKLKCNFGILFYYPRINRMYFYPVSNNMDLLDISEAMKSKQIKINDEHLI